MNFTVYVGIGILLVLAIIGFLILLRRDSFKSKKSKRIYIVTGALQAVHIILYLTGLLEKIAQINVYIAFGICAIVSIICILMSGWMLLPFSKFKHGIKYLLMLIAILQVISTIIIFLLPEAGIPPLIQLSACGEQQELVDMESVIIDDKWAVIWEERVYVLFCVVSKNDRGAQIGYVDGNPDDRISEFKGFLPEEWIVSWMPMDGGAMLLKEENVADIPAGLKQEY
ncbi:MAG: hypothetical protein NC331_03485 [Lachnospiraceae bacterium]|nr:hypothetical protein [Lachnospiraceae bacterium]